MAHSHYSIPDTVCVPFSSALSNQVNPAAAMVYTVIKDNCPPDGTWHMLRDMDIEAVTGFRGARIGAARRRLIKEGLIQTQRMGCPPKLAYRLLMTLDDWIKYQGENVITLADGTATDWIKYQGENS
jgi:hypothetical protein